jgi:hypothetical protein
LLQNRNQALDKSSELEKTRMKLEAELKLNSEKLNYYCIRNQELTQQLHALKSQEQKIHLNCTLYSVMIFSESL